MAVSVAHVSVAHVSVETVHVAEAPHFSEGEHVSVSSEEESHASSAPLEEMVQPLPANRLLVRPHSTASSGNDSASSIPPQADSSAELVIAGCVLSVVLIYVWLYRRTFH